MNPNHSERSSKRPLKAAARLTFRYAILGAWFGLLFPVLAVYIQLHLNGLAITPANMIIIQKAEPLIWIIDTAPLFLGLFAWFIGKNAWKYSSSISRLSTLTDDLRRLDIAHARALEEKEIILNSVSECVIYHDTRLRVIWANRAAVETTKYTESEIIGRKCHEIWADSDKPCPDCPIEKVVLTGRQTEIEKETDQGKVWHVRGYPVKNDQGAIVGVVEVAQNITDKTKLARRLKDSEEKYRSFVERATDGIVIIQDERVKYVNPCLAGLLDLERSKITGEIFTDFIFPDERNRLMQIYERRMTGEYFPPVYETAVIGKNGERIEVEVNSGLINYEGRKADLAFIRDITERKQAQIAVQEAEERYRELIENISEVIYSLDDKGIIGYISPAIRYFAEYNPMEMIDKKLLEFIHEDDLRLFTDNYDSILQGKAANFECRLMTKLDNISWVRISGRPVYDDQRIAGVQGLLIDITNQRAAELALYESEKRYRAITEVTSDYTYAFKVNEDNTFELDWIAGALYKITGFTAEEIRAGGGFIKGLIHPGDVERLERIIQKLLANSEDISIFRIVTKSGEERIINHIGRPVWSAKDNRVVEIIGAGKDITDQVRAEEALRESEERFRHIFEYAGVGVSLVGVNGNGIESNYAFRKMLGYTRTELRQMHISDLFHPDDWEKEKYLFKNLKTAAIDRFTTEKRFIRKDGGIVWTNTTVSLIRNSSGEPLNVISVVEDITERRLAEQQKRKLQKKLQKAERMESLGMLAGGIAHDLNNMLGPLVGYSDMLLAQLEDGDPVRKKIERIMRSSQDAAHIIQDLLTLARRGRYEMTPIDFSDVVGNYLESPAFLQKKSQNPKVSLKIDLKQDLPNIMGSAPHLFKVVMNLIVNAFDAMPGGGRLQISTSEVHLERLILGQVELVPGDYIRFVVSDTGTGIGGDDLKRIFEPYYSKKKLGTSGSGLGLAVVYGILKDHKGYYDIVTEIGKGTSFILYFPVTYDESIAGEVVDGDYSGRETILIVDDALEQRELTSEILRNFGYTVQVAENGHKAVEFVKKQPFDLVILDMIMEADYDGLDTYRDILRINPGQKAIIISGFSASERVVEMQKLGAGRYLKKPFTMADLGRAVRQELDNIAKTVSATT